MHYLEARIYHLKFDLPPLFVFFTNEGMQVKINKRLPWKRNPFRRTTKMSDGKKKMINTCNSTSLHVTAFDNIRSAKCVGLLVKNTNKGA